MKILSDPEKIREVEGAVVFLRDVFGSMDLGEVEITSNTTLQTVLLWMWILKGEDMEYPHRKKRPNTGFSLIIKRSLVVNKASTHIRVKLVTGIQTPS